MYAAKPAGGVRVYDPAGSGRAGGNPQTAHELYTAIETAGGRAPRGAAGTLLLRYQPKLDLRTRRVSDFEVLVRWQHPRRGLIPPAVFLPLAERAGLMGPLTEVVLREALTWCRGWQRARSGRHGGGQRVGHQPGRPAVRGPDRGPARPSSGCRRPRSPWRSPRTR